MYASQSSVSRALPILITLLALADGILHLSLDAVMFRGNFFGPLGPPPGSTSGPPPGGFPPPPPIPFPLPINQMFVLNFVGYVALVVLFWALLRQSSAARRWLDLAFIAYVILAILAWVDFGMPNPMGLGYLSKIVEIGLLVGLVVHVRRRLANRTGSTVNRGVGAT